MQNSKLQILISRLEKLYADNQDKLLFHGWHHIYFVWKKAAEFAKSIGANQLIAESAALVHDLNYIAVKNSNPEAGSKLRQTLLADCGYTPAEISQIEKVILEAHTEYRGAEISLEGIALSDADTLWKALPTTPIVFASKYLTQNDVDISELAHKVVSEQLPLLEQGIYFYTDLAREKYLKWAETNLNLWSNVLEALKDEDVQAVLEIAKSSKVI